MSIRNRISQAIAAVGELGRMWPWALVSIIALGAVLLLNPAKGGAYLWILSKLALAAVVGYGVDLAAFSQRPTALEGIEKAMAQTRRATLIAAAMVAAGLMP